MLTLYGRGFRVVAFVAALALLSVDSTWAAGRVMRDDGAGADGKFAINLPDEVDVRPLIGIYTQDTNPKWPEFPGKKDEYIAASYVKLVESAGARPVPVSYNLAHDDLVATLDRLNGFIFPGGGMDLHLNTTYQKSSKTIIDYAYSKYNWPVVGICLGFEVIATIMANDSSILTLKDSANMLDRPVVTKQFEYSKFKEFAGFFYSEWTVFENHISGVTPEDFKAKLSKHFLPLAISQDRNNKAYVSAMEAFRYPIFGFQFHPEKTMFEWNPAEVISHSSLDLGATQAVAKVLARFSRLNAKKNPVNETEVVKMMIYNTPAVYTKPYAPDFSFEQVYFFPKGYSVLH